ncbi:MAG: response regulator [Candidatus Saganbacteria bacterium]|nr:response regulator [Candidatus Saganbacteria bacterium]
MAKKILIVDDDPAVLELLKFAVESEKYSAVLAKDGKEALELTREERPDLILLDIMLPYIDGYNVLESLRKDKNLKILPIIVVSAKIREVDINFGLQLGANYYMTKPLDLDLLIERIKELLS